MRQPRRRKSLSHLPLLERVERALITAAELVEHHGGVYLPIFERLERELISMYRQASAVERARKLARTADLADYRAPPEDQSRY